MKIAPALPGTCFLAACFLAGMVAAGAQDTEKPLSAQQFARKDQRLGVDEAARYLIYRDKIPYSDLVPVGQTAIDPHALVEKMSDRLDDLRSKTRHGAPWTWQELDAAFPPEKTKAEAEAEVPGWKKIEGLTKAKKFGEDGNGGSIGPLRLRKSVDDLPKALADAKGATLGYSDNRLHSGRGAWNSEGVLDLPFTFHPNGGKQLVTMGPAVQWKLAETQETDKKDVQELTFAVPISLSFDAVNHTPYDSYEEAYAASRGGIPTARWIIQARPYYQTDFSFEYAIYGVEASVDFVGGAFGSKLFLGDYQNLGSSGLQYQLRITPKANWSETDREGQYTSRKKGDDWFRVGALLEFDLRLGAKTFNPLDLGVTYEFFETVSGTGDFVDLFKAHATLWINENAGLTLEYTRGDTPIAEKKIDLVTLSLELKY